VARRQRLPRQGTEQVTRRDIERLGEQVVADTRMRMFGAREAYSKAEAAQVLGCSVDFLDKHVLSDLATTRRGGRVLIPRAEIHRWLADTSRKALP
jgi:excisionase family DNA binding protein